VQSTDEIRKRNKARAIRLSQTRERAGRGEGEVLRLLIKRGLKPVPQFPVEGYNIDLAIAPVAVEVHVSANNPLTDKVLRKRLKKLIELDWFVFYIWVTNKHWLTEDAVDEAVAYYELAKSAPASIGKYRVVRGSGELCTTRCLEDYD